MKSAVLFLLAPLIMSLATPSDDVQPSFYPPFENEVGNETWGHGIQRTMALLEGSSLQDRHEARILFYGQSITGGRWHVGVERALRERYPHARIILENRAIGGFSSPRLIRSAFHDVYSFQPDLVVFHVYGDVVEYERIIHEIRQNTVAEILIMTDHWKRNSKVDGRYELDGHSAFMDKMALPAIAAKYGCELVDVRWPWKRYLDRHGLEPGDLLKDNVHLNDHGRWLMAQICLQRFRYAPELMSDISRHLVTAHRVGEDVVWADGQLAMEFGGNRVDVVTDEDNGAAVTVRVDGRRPSEISSLYAFTRPTSVIAPQEWPLLRRVERGPTMPLIEDWHIEILELSGDHETVRFKVAGSRTGPDGEGLSTEKFVSGSGRVVIHPDDWFLANSHRLRGEKAKVGFRSYWRCEATHLDVFIPERHLVAPGEKMVTTLFHGLANQKHRLELRAHGLNPPPIAALRIYSPPVPEGPFKPIEFERGEGKDHIDPAMLLPDSR